jgi:hypothetical protein
MIRELNTPRYAWSVTNRVPVEINAAEREIQQLGTAGQVVQVAVGTSLLVPALLLAFSHQIRAWS